MGRGAIITHVENNHVFSIIHVYLSLCYSLPVPSSLLASSLVNRIFISFVLQQDEKPSQSFLPCRSSTSTFPKVFMMEVRFTILLGADFFSKSSNLKKKKIHMKYMLSNNNIPQFLRSSCWKKRNECFVTFDVVLMKHFQNFCRQIYRLMHQKCPL